MSVPTTVPAALDTVRLRLRPWSADDAPELLPLLEANHARLAPWIPPHVSTPLPVPALAERLAGFARDFAEARAYRWAMRDGADGRLLGEVDLFPRDGAGRVPLAAADRVEVGYWLDAAATGRGLVTEAVRAMVELAARLPAVSSVEIRCDAANAASAAVPARLGFALASEEAGAQVWRLALAR